MREEEDNISEKIPNLIKISFIILLYSNEQLSKFKCVISR